MRPKPLADVPSLQRDLLFLLDDNPGLSGSELRDEIEDAYGNTIRRSTFYDALRQLEDDGFLDVGRDGRESAIRLSGTGRERLDAHRRWSE